VKITPDPITLLLQWVHGCWPWCETRRDRGMLEVYRLQWVHGPAVVRDTRRVEQLHVGVTAMGPRPLADAANLLQ
jgi:hypothetical protein